MRRLDRNNQGDVFDQMQKMFEEMQQMGKNIVPSNSMPVDIREEENEIIITADLPGIQKEDISLKANEEGLVITGEGREEIKEENEKYIRRERSSRKFQRKIKWPNPVKTETIEAEYDDGVLEITAEKDSSEGHDIEIN